VVTKNAKQSQIYRSSLTIDEPNFLPQNDLAKFTPQKMLRTKEETEGKSG
jgi:hypothetical protein